MQDILVTVYHDNTCPFLSVRRQKNTNNGDTVTKYVLSAGENIPNFSKGQIYHGCQNRYLFEIYLGETFHLESVVCVKNEVGAEEPTKMTTTSRDSRDEVRGRDGAMDS